MSTFIQDILTNKATENDIDDYIEHWHKEPITMSLREFLGMTPLEYQTWGIYGNKMLSDIILCRKTDTDYKIYLRRKNNEL